ncbi:accessory gene regulator ArgB-like protein [Desulfotomaculum copahuensis]|uniref:Accessory regulator AgrB n=1 Tax=Desulfotomaculum copahuensis TaxID=1838280 RepID=A0A1B7LKQ8_9FIRM|nr:accessory gene regulator B family protein [Desulfotomaculum copahuensis]OAT87052.1 hypothetical protein A6M21_01780 [Desulfotomaculum copahuensis]
MFSAPHRFTGRLGEKLSRSADEMEIASYGLQMLALTAADLIAVLLVGWLLGCLTETLAVLLVAGLLRSFSGGAHSNSPLRCLIFGALAVPALGKIAATGAPLLPSAVLMAVITVGLLVSLPVVWRLAPVDSPAKPITSPHHRRNLHHLSVAGVVAVALLQSIMLLNQRPDLILAMEFGLLWQVFSLTTTGHRLLARLDRLLSLNLIRGGESI